MIRNCSGDITVSLHPETFTGAWQDEFIGLPSGALRDAAQVGADLIVGRVVELGDVRLQKEELSEPDDRSYAPDIALLDKQDTVTKLAPGVSQELWELLRDLPDFDEPERELMLLGRGLIMAKRGAQALARNRNAHPYQFNHSWVTDLRVNRPIAQVLPEDADVPSRKQALQSVSARVFHDRNEESSTISFSGVFGMTHAQHNLQASATIIRKGDDAASVRVASGMSSTTTHTQTSFLETSSRDPVRDLTMLGHMATLL